MSYEPDELVTQACKGDMGPLLAALKDAPMSGPPAVNTSNPGDPPKNQLWYAVLSARADGDLSPSQFEQCLAAVRGS